MASLPIPTQPYPTHGIQPRAPLYPPHPSTGYVQPPAEVLERLVACLDSPDLALLQVPQDTFKFDGLN